MEAPHRALTPREEERALRRLLGDGIARALRDLAGLTPQQLADLVGVPVEELVAWENATAFPEDPYAVRKYAAVLRRLCVTPPAPKG